MLDEKVLTYVEIYDACLRRIRDYNRDVNAIINIDIDAPSVGYVFQKALHGRKPLHGIPMSVKDTIFTSTIVTTAGKKDILETSRESEIVTILRQLGAFVISKTNCPPFSVDVQTFNDLMPPCKNPWDLTRTAGGSSGGSAVSVAMGFDHFSVGTDLNGSLRIPAAFNHVCSIKPTENVLPSHDVIPPLIPTHKKKYNLTVGFIARRVKDLQVVMREVLVAISKEMPHHESGDKDKKIIITTNFPEVETDNRIIQAMKQLYDFLLTFDGIDIELKMPDIDMKQLVKIQSILVNSYINEDTENFRHVDKSKIPTEDELNWAIKKKEEFKRKVDDEIMAGADIWILPVSPTLPYPHNLSHTPIEINGKLVNYWKATVPYCTPLSISGHPVVTLPVTLIDGLPFGVQVVGQYNEDMKLLSIAEELDKVLDNKQAPPLLQKIIPFH